MVNLMVKITRKALASPCGPTLSGVRQQRRRGGGAALALVLLLTRARFHRGEEDMSLARLMRPRRFARRLSLPLLRGRGGLGLGLLHRIGHGLRLGDLLRLRLNLNHPPRFGMALRASSHGWWVQHSS